MNASAISTPVYIQVGDGKMLEKIESTRTWLIAGVLGFLVLWFGGIYLAVQNGFLG